MKLRDKSYWIKNNQIFSGNTNNAKILELLIVTAICSSGKPGTSIEQLAKVHNIQSLKSHGIAQAPK